MSNLKVGVRQIKIVDFARQKVSKEQALKIERFANENGYERVIDMKSPDSQYVRFELDRRNVGTPFILIEEEKGIYTVGGRVRGLHADLFLEEFCDEQGND